MTARGSRSCRMMPMESASCPLPSRAASTARGVSETLPHSRFMPNSTKSPAVRAR